MCYIEGSLNQIEMAIIKANLRFRLHDKVEIDGDIEDHSQIQYFEFDAWKEGPETKFLNIGSVFTFDEKRYEIVNILTNLMVWSPADATGDQINSKSELFVFYYVKEL